jgi:ERCC4-related helicase
MTEGSRDVTYHFAARRKESKMKSVLKDMKTSGKLEKDKQNSRIDYIGD